MVGEGGPMRHYGWCMHPDHSAGPHRLVDECVDPESTVERVTAIYQHRVDVAFWRMVEGYDAETPDRD